MADVLISEFMDEGSAAEMMAEFDVHWDPKLWSKRDELLEQVANARAIVVRNATRVDAELIAAAPRLEVVARMGVGLDNIDLETCKARGIEVCPSIGANAQSVAEYVIATAMILLRGQALMSTHRLVAGEWPRESLARGIELAGRSLGIVGFGSIGQVMAAKAKAMGMEIMAYDAMLPADAPAWEGVRNVGLEDLIVEADVITLHCPLTPETRDLISTDELARMKPGAILVNSARGGIVNEAACAAALKSGHLGGAALDTFDTEPIRPETGALFAGLDNVILTPHVAGVTQQANKRISDAAVVTVRRVLGGKA
ncbi:MAG TPA: hydroxyacid dehydrogenase [Afifellaceae bacterium]|nr:hydroxyacid dehydrogenase [Afifellaceae bacterium]